MIKRIFDIVLSGFLLIILAPLFVIIALCIKLDDEKMYFIIKPDVPEE